MEDLLTQLVTAAGPLAIVLYWQELRLRSHTAAAKDHLDREAQDARNRETRMAARLDDLTDRIASDMESALRDSTQVIASNSTLLAKLTTLLTANHPTIPMKDTTP